MNLCIAGKSRYHNRPRGVRGRVMKCLPANPIPIIFAYLSIDVYIHNGNRIPFVGNADRSAQGYEI